MTIKENISLLPYNTFHIDATARLFVEIDQVSDLQELLKDQAYANIPKLILGGGSNILFTRDFDGLVIKMNIRFKHRIRENADSVWIQAGAGIEWHEFVMYCTDRGLGGIENLALIPGTLGAAPMQNIGAYGVEIKDTFVSLEAVHMQTGELRIFDNEACEFGYRESVFKTSLKGQYIITSVTLKLSKHPIINTSYGAIEETMKQLQAGSTSNVAPGIKEVSEAVMYIRQSKLPDPKVIGNAGSFFKNPIVSADVYENIKKQYPYIPAYPLPDGSVKVPAGWLIEQAGWKGKKAGAVGVHDKQALVLVNHGKGRGDEIVRLSEEIQASVWDKFGIQLGPEVNFV